MIMFWNQKEVFLGTSLQKFSEIRNLLTANKIGYKYKIVDQVGEHRHGANRVRTGNSNINIEHSHLYYIYVHKKDYEKASDIIQSC